MSDAAELVDFPLAAFAVTPGADVPSDQADPRDLLDGSASHELVTLRHVVRQLAGRYRGHLSAPELVTLVRNEWQRQGARLELPDAELLVLTADALARTGAFVPQITARPLSAIDRSAPEPLEDGRWDPNGHSILFGAGGAGKGTLATYSIGRLVRAGHRVLVIDYENHPDEWARRYFGFYGADGAGAVYHVAPLTPDFEGSHGAIWDAAAELAELATRLEITFVVVDSIVPACGGADPMDPGAPARYASAIQRLDLPVLSLAHVTKADDLRYPFGSVFWHNLARVTWSLARDGDHLILAHRKANSYGNQGRAVVSVTWLDGLPRDLCERPYSAALADRIDEALARESLTVAAIVKRLNEDAAADDAEPVKTNSVRHALTRGLKSDPKRYAIEGTGDGATWRRA